MKIINLTERQRKQLEKVWFIYGNFGNKHTHCNHRFIQNFLEHGEDTEKFYRQANNNDLTEECVAEVRKILSNGD